MELLFETRLAITDVRGKLYFVQEQPQTVPDPVMTPEGVCEGNRIAVHTVLRDGGRLRMWYRPFPQADKIDLNCVVAHAESDDGIHWRRTPLGLLDTSPHPNNYTDFGLASCSVFIDPTSSPSRRYRGVGYRRPGDKGANPQGTKGCIYTAHSSDGLHWDLDSSEPRWLTGDVVNSAYHPGRGHGLCGMKYSRRMNGITRRAIWTADLHGDAWSDPSCALVPDAFDDVAAIARGYNSSDHYGMGFLPAGRGTVGFVWNFRHKLPLGNKPEHYALYGDCDVSLAYQECAGDRWLHVPSRQSFMNCGSQPWNAGWIRTASAPVEVGDEHWLYFAADAHDHAWHMDADWQPIEKWTRVRQENGFYSVVGLAKWPKWRLFGYHADPEGSVDIEMGEILEPSELLLNYKAACEGNVRVQVFAREGRGDCQDIPGRSDPADSVPLTGDSVGEVVAWKSGTVIHPVPGRRIVARLTLGNATAYAWDLRPVSQPSHGMVIQS